MLLIETGNLNKKVSKSPRSRGWFIGRFIKDLSLFKDSDLEVKWANHKKGENLNKIRATKKSKTLAILINGKIKMSFPDQKKDFILSKQGDFTFWGEKIFHCTEVLEDSTVLVIRWPSLTNNIIIR